ncbi:unnamed protein product [Umbelopsis vinacea]
MELNFRKKKISRQNNARDLPAIKQHLTRENPQVDWNSMDEIVVNLCMNCDRKWRKFRDGYIREHDNHSTDHSTADTRSSDGLAIPSTSHRSLNTEPGTLQDELEEPNRSSIEPPREPSSDIPTTRKRRRRYAAMSELHQLTSSNFALNATSHRLFEQEVHFQHNIFTSDQALRLGLTILDIANAQSHGSLVIDITVNGYQLFRFAMQGTGPDYDEWIRRKRNVVDRFRHSSALVQSQIDYLGSNAAERYPINDPQYAFYPGAFPLIISGVGVVGTVTIAGSNLRADHDIIITALEKLASDQPTLNESIALDISGSRTRVT